MGCPTREFKIAPDFLLSISSIISISFDIIGLVTDSSPDLTIGQ